MIASYFDITQDELDNLNISPGNLYICNDTKRFYYDSVVTNERIELGCDFVLCNSLPLAPIPNTIYFKYNENENASLNIFSEQGWLTYQLINQTIVLKNIIIPEGTTEFTISDARILDCYTGKFYVDLSISDLVETDIDVICGIHNVKISLPTEYDYPIFGDLVLS